MAKPDDGIRDYRDVAIPDAADGLSSVVDLEGYRIVAIAMPADWTTGDLTFKALNPSNGQYYDLYDDNDAEVVVQAAEDRVIALRGVTADQLACVRYVKVRSGVSATPVDQNATRIITLILMPAK